MTLEQAFYKIIDSLKRILLYANLGKYNHVMHSEDIDNIKKTLENIISCEDDFKNARTVEEKDLIFKSIQKYQNFSIRDFMDFKIDRL